MAPNLQNSFMPLWFALAFPWRRSISCALVAPLVFLLFGVPFHAVAIDLWSALSSADLMVSLASNCTIRASLLFFAFGCQSPWLESQRWMSEVQGGDLKMLDSLQRLCRWHCSFPHLSYTRVHERSLALDGDISWLSTEVHLKSCDGGFSNRVRSQQMRPSFRTRPRAVLWPRCFCAGHGTCSQGFHHER